jgi:hypothetical protein
MKILGTSIGSVARLEKGESICWLPAYPSLDDLRKMSGLLEQAIAGKLPDTSIDDLTEMLRMGIKMHMACLGKALAKDA